MTMAGRVRPQTALRIGLAQLNTTVGDLQGNLQKIQQTIAEAIRGGCNMVAFPELALTGYPPEDLLLKPTFVDEALTALKTAAAAAQGITVIVGALDRDRRGRLFNAAAVCARGRVRAVYHKMLLPNYGVFDEQRYFAPGSRPLVFQWRGVRLGINICEDIWHDDGPLLAQARAGAALILNISASPYHAGKLQERRALLQRWAKRAHAPPAGPPPRVW